MAEAKKATPVRKKASSKSKPVTKKAPVKKKKTTKAKAVTDILVEALTPVKPAEKVETTAPEVEVSATDEPRRVGTRTERARNKRHMRRHDARREPRVREGIDTPLPFAYFKSLVYKHPKRGDMPLTDVIRFREDVYKQSLDDPWCGARGSVRLFGPDKLIVTLEYVATFVGRTALENKIRNATLAYFKKLNLPRDLEITILEATA